MSFKNAFLLSTFLLGTLAAVESAHAFPLTSRKAFQNYQVRILGDTFDVGGVVAMSNCSASFVRFKGASDDSPGMVLTNGHCSGGAFGGMPRPGQVISNQPRNFSLALLDQNGDTIGNLRSEKIIYATMTDTDISLLALTQTYRQIKTLTGVEPLILSDQKPSVGTPIEIPSGYWQRTFRCQIDGFVYALHEAEWVFRDSVRYSATGCDVIGGTSGSPIVSAKSGEVIAINNTGNEDGRTCTLNNPCEIDPSGRQTVLKGRGYAQQTYWLYSCLTDDARFDLDVSGCILPKIVN